jgi:AcrR family transcriptional regulator
MDAVDNLMREEGYAALSARNVARRARLKYQIVFYYFGTMDDLLLATYQRRINVQSQRVEQALSSPRPLHAIWASLSDSADAALSLEYMAMSNHNPAIRDETVRFGERIRRKLAAELVLRPGRAGLSSAAKPLAVTWLLNAVMSLLSFESAIGISGGHREVIAMMEEYLDQIEPEDSVQPEDKRRPGDGRLQRSG